jgi:hypothetical protein
VGGPPTIYGPHDDWEVRTRSERIGSSKPMALREARRTVTIVVTAASPDGIILASDSRTTRLRAGGGYRIVSDNTQKLFAPFPGIGIATSGAAFVGARTINGLIDEWAARRSGRASAALDAVAADLGRFFRDTLADYEQESGQRVPKNVLGFLVAGYDSAGIGRVRELRLPPGGGRRRLVERPDIDTSGRGLLWRGRTQFIRRLMEGFDRDAFEKAAGGPLDPALDIQIRRLLFVIQEPITLQDALDAATFAVRLTIDMERLTDGLVTEQGSVPACGGRVQALAVYRGRTEWVEQPSLALSPAGGGEAA